MTQHRSARLAGGVFLLILATGPAYADFKIQSPIVEEGELEFEQNGDVTFDKNPDKGGEKSFTHEIGYGVTDWWEPELELETDREAEPGERLRLSQLTLENNFQLTEAGEYWADFGWFAEYGHTLREDEADEITMGPTIRKEIGWTVHTLNVFLEREVGAARDPEAGTELHYAWQSQWRLSESFQPGIEIYGTPGRIDHFDRYADQDLRAGPVVSGLFRMYPYGNLKYDVGYLAGLTRGTADSTIRWRLEWEIPL
jgi:hypothetical protein